MCGRVAHALLKKPDRCPGAGDYGQVSRQDLAKTIGASREMVSRVMKDLEARGFIQTLPSGAMVLKTAWRHSADPHQAPCAAGSHGVSFARL